MFALLDLCWKFARASAAYRVRIYHRRSAGLSPARDVTSCVYRIARESLQNVAKHSKAKQGSIALAWEQGAIVLKIADDGDGFDHQRVKGMGGLGLIGMEERARLVNGKLTIASQVGNGTRVTLQVPLEAPALGREEILGSGAKTLATRRHCAGRCFSTAPRSNVNAHATRLCFRAPLACFAGGRTFGRWRAAQAIVPEFQIIFI